MQQSCAPTYALATHVVSIGVTSTVWTVIILFFYRISGKFREAKASDSGT
jgi:hypothetical protein